MDKARMEAFSDGVMAIIITLLVLTLSVPMTSDFEALLSLKEPFLVYGLSYFILAIYWVNHHHLLQIADKINGHVLWANILNLFSISLLPFVTVWLGKNFNSLIPALLYGLVYLFTLVTSAILQYSLIQCNGDRSKIATTLSYKKLLISIGVVLIALLLGLILPVLTPIVIFGLLTMWMIPSRAIEHVITERNTN